MEYSNIILGIRCHFINNSAGEEGTIATWMAQSLTFIDSIFKGNNANYDKGGALHIEDSEITLVTAISLIIQQAQVVPSFCWGKGDI